MKRSLILILALTALCATSTLAQKGQKPDPWMQAGADDSLREAFEKAIYALKDTGQGTGTETWTGSNDAQSLSVEFDAHEVRLKHPYGSVAFHLSGYGCGDKLKTPAAPKLAGDGTRLEYRRGDFTEWYVNGRQGLEQGFTLAEKPVGRSKGQPLTIALEVTGTLALSQLDGAVLLKSAKSTVLRYGGLSARDALGHPIPAHLEARNNEIRLVVDDEQAHYPLTVDPSWTQQQELTAADGATNDNFGTSVAISGPTAVIGAPGHDDDAGAAYVFVHSNGTWSLQKELTASGASSFGQSVAVSGTTAVIGANDAAFVFVQSNGTWSLQKELTDSEGSTSDNFGSSVAVSGTTVVIGAYDKEIAHPAQGAAYVYVQSNGAWSLQKELTASDAASDGQFGYAVAVSGTTAVIGAPDQIIGGNLYQGAAYVFVQSNGTWTQQAELTLVGGHAYDTFGNSVAVSGKTAVIGAKYLGAAFVFAQDGSSWNQQAKLTGAGSFGVSVAVSGTTAVIGNGLSAFVFTQSNGTWSQQQELNASDGASGDEFGLSVALDGSTAVIGDPDHTVVHNSSQGAAYVFEGPLSPSTLSTPNPGSTLMSATEVFTWSAVNGASAYDLHLSAVAPGDYDLYTSGHITRTSTPVYRLPTNGETIYARLYTLASDGSTVYNDYTFTAGPLARLLYPAPGSTLPSSNIWFDWTAGTGVTQYDLHLSGVAPGGYDLYSSGPTTRTYRTVPTLPTNGETIYARLYSFIGGVTYYNDYTYKAQ
jgi:hypothetical protein